MCIEVQLLVGCVMGGHEDEERAYRQAGTGRRRGEAAAPLNNEAWEERLKKKKEKQRNMEVLLVIHYRG